MRTTTRSTINIHRSPAGHADAADDASSTFDTARSLGRITGGRRSHPAHLRYNPDETLDNFRRRQRHAYLAGKLAWREHLINAQALQLYNELIHVVGANKFAWIKEETLAQHFDRSVSTIKRWISQLVHAGLIQRGRRFGSASLTSITAYQRDAPEQQPSITPVPAEPALPPARPAEDAPMPPTQVRPTAAVSAQSEPDASAKECSSAPQTSFVGSGSEPSISSFLRRHTMKTHHVNFSGGGGESIPPAFEIVRETEATRRLQAEGVGDPDVLQELGHRPLGEIERVIRYVARCRSADDLRRPGLIVHLVRRGFGTQRPSAAQGGRRRDGDRRKTAGSVSSARGARAAHSIAAAEPRGYEPVAPATAGEPVAAGASELGQVWVSAQERLQGMLTSEEYEIWLATTALLMLKDGVAVVGTPNIFVREKLTESYRLQLEAALETVVGHAVEVEVVVDVLPS
jgi:hypothetical protein